MARKDVIEYYLLQQQVYFELLDTVKDLEQLRREGTLTQEQVDETMHEIDIVKSDYERLSYIVMLLNQPKRKEKKEKEYEQNQAIYKALHLLGASKEAVLDESKDALADLKKLLEQVKGNMNEC